MAGKINVSELRQTGYAYVNAANFMVRVAREQALAQEAVDKHNRELLKQKKRTESIQDMEAELERLTKLLNQKRKA